MNKDEMKMIEDMARILCGRTNKCDECVMPLTPICGYKSYCEILHNEDYRKVAENSVVMSREEYEILTEISTLKDKVQEALNINPIEELIQVERETRKQAIKEVLEKVRNNFIEQAAYSCDCSQHCGYYDYKIGISEVVEQIDELAKEMGVEI